MDRRRIVKSGNTSFTLALPISWVRKNSLVRGSEVLLEEEQSGELTISTLPQEKLSGETIGTIRAEGKTIHELQLEILEQYVGDATTIVIDGKELRARGEEILSFVKMLIGLDVMEQTGQYITLKNFFVLDKETTPGFITRKMNLVNLSLFFITEQFFTKGITKDDVLESLRLKQQNERLFHLVRKATAKLFREPILTKKFQTTLEQVAKEKLIALNLKNMSILLSSFIDSLLLLEHTRGKTELLKQVFFDVKESYTKVMGAVSKRNREAIRSYLANSTENVDSWRRTLRHIDDSIITECVHHAVSFCTLLDDIAYQVLE